MVLLLYLSMWRTIYYIYGKNAYLKCLKKVALSSFSQICIQNFFKISFGGQDVVCQTTDPGDTRLVFSSICAIPIGHMKLSFTWDTNHQMGCIDKAIIQDLFMTLLIPPGIDFHCAWKEFNPTDIGLSERKTKK